MDVLKITLLTVFSAGSLLAEDVSNIPATGKQEFTDLVTENEPSSFSKKISYVSLDLANTSGTHGLGVMSQGFQEKSTSKHDYQIQATSLTEGGSLSFKGDYQKTFFPSRIAAPGGSYQGFNCGFGLGGELGLTSLSFQPSLEGVAFIGHKGDKLSTQLKSGLSGSLTAINALFAEGSVGYLWNNLTPELECGISTEPNFRNYTLRGKSSISYLWNKFSTKVNFQRTLTTLPVQNIKDTSYLSLGYKENKYKVGIDFPLYGTTTTKASVNYTGDLLYTDLSLGLSGKNRINSLKGKFGYCF